MDLILKEHFYKHHYLSITINTICFIILFIFDIVDSDSYFFLILLYDIYLSFIAIENAYGKKAMIYSYEYFFNHFYSYYGNNRR